MVESVRAAFLLIAADEASVVARVFGIALEIEGDDPSEIHRIRATSLVMEADVVLDAMRSLPLCFV